MVGAGVPRVNKAAPAAQCGDLQFGWFG